MSLVVLVLAIVLIGLLVGFAQTARMAPFFKTAATWVGIASVIFLIGSAFGVWELLLDIPTPNLAELYHHHHSAYHALP